MGRGKPTLTGGLALNHAVLGHVASISLFAHLWQCFIYRKFVFSRCYDILSRWKLPILWGSRAPVNGLSTEPPPDGLVVADGIASGSGLPEQGGAGIEKAFAGIAKTRASKFFQVNDKILDRTSLGT